MKPYFKVGMLQLLNILGFILMIITNGLADFLPINGQTTGEVADQYPHLFLPAPITFAIWAVIYSLLLLFVIYQGSTLFEAEKRGMDKRERVAESIGYLFVLSCALNIAWIFSWHHHLLLLTVFIMLGLLLTLIRLFTIVHSTHTYAGHKARWFVYAPFSIYLAWICVATVANISSWLVSIGWNGWNIDHPIWACVMIACTMLLAIMMLVKKNNLFFVAVVVWALGGILLRQYPQSGWNTVSIAAVSAGIFLLVLTVIKLSTRSVRMA